MNRRVILIGRLNSFMVNAVDKGLVNDGIDVRRTDIDVTRINDARDMDDSVFIFYLVSSEDVKTEVLVYLREKIEEEKIHLAVVGNPQELFEVRDYIKESKNVKIYERPLDVSVLVGQINEFFDDVIRQRAKKRILVVDDNAVSLRTMRDILQDRYIVSIVNSGASAVTFLVKNEVDLILLDYEMPVVSGPQVLEMIRDEPSIEAPPVMFLTAKNDAQSVKTALALKPVKYLLKSLPSDELIETIEEFFNGR